MAAVPASHLKVGRVLFQDDDFITVEIGKHDGVTFNLQQNDEGEVVGGDEFLTMIFVRNKNGAMKTWEPWVTE